MIRPLADDSLGSSVLAELSLANPWLQVRLVHGRRLLVSVCGAGQVGGLTLLVLECPWQLWLNRIEGRSFRLALDHDDGGLPEKPRHDRDWADNVYRSRLLMTYNLTLYILYHRMLLSGHPARGQEQALSEKARVRARHMREEVNRKLWLEERGCCAEYRAPEGFLEDHLAIEILTALRFGLADDRQAARVSRTVEQHLETRNDPAQPYGDWGVMCAWPPYRRHGGLRCKSTSPYRCHDGSGWPYWDGVYAGLVLERGGPAGLGYPFLCWREYGLEQSRPTPVEHYGPPYGRGVLLQAWSSLPTAVALRWAEPTR